MVAETRDEPIRVLYVVEGVLSGSARRAVLLLASRLPRGRFETVVASAPEGDFVEALQRRGVTVTPLERPGGFGPDLVLGPAREMRRHGAQVVHLYGCVRPAIAAAARLARVPALVCSRDVQADAALPRSGWQGLGRRLLTRAADRLIDRHVAAGRSEVRALTDDYGIDPARIFMIPLGIDVDQFAPGRVRRGAWRERVGHPLQAPVICALLGRDLEVSGAGLLGALKRIEVRTGWIAVVVGAGPSSPELQARARSLELGDRVRFADDPGEATRELLADADLVVALGGGGDPIGLREAMALARPVVAWDSEDAADAVSDGVDGRVVAAGDGAALAAAITALLRDPVAARRLGRNARRKAEREFSAERMVRRAGILYEEVLRGKGLLADSAAGVGASR